MLICVRNELIKYLHMMLQIEVEKNPCEIYWSPHSYTMIVVSANSGTPASVGADGVGLSFKG